MQPHEVMSYVLPMCVCVCVSPAREVEALGLACKRDSDELERVAPGFLDCQPSWLQQKQEMREYVVAALLSEQLQLMAEDPNQVGPAASQFFCPAVCYSFIHGQAQLGLPAPCVAST